MNKKTKGAIAAGAAAALLAGGASTFALWSDTASATGGTITAGQLKFDGAVPAGTWYKGTDSINIATYKIVPGEALTYKASPTVIAEGDSLSATVTASTPTLTGTGLQTHLTVGTPTITGTGVTNGTTITSASGPRTLEVSVPVTFGDVTGLTAQNTNAVLSSITLTLTQTN